MESYISVSKKVIDLFKKLYDGMYTTIGIKESFTKVMESNESRLMFLNTLFDNINRDGLSEEGRKLFDKNIDFIHAFMNGKLNKEIPVPKEYSIDMTEYKIIPTQDDIRFLFTLIEENVKMYNSVYKNKLFYSILPNNSFNMNMGRVFDIKERNIAHLLGLTESEYEEDKNKNLLKKYFLKIIPDNYKYGARDSVSLLNWLLTSEGKKEILKLNQITLDFIEKDMKKYPNSYHNGRIKNVDDKFKERFKKETGLDYPIIKFSRYMVKCINSLNFLNMTNITQIILDFNSRRDSEGKKIDKDEKDMFFVSLSAKKLEELQERYLIKYQEEVDVYLENYKKNGYQKDDIIFKELKEMGLTDNEITVFLNVHQTHDFVGKHGIMVNESVYNNALQKIANYIAKDFYKEIHLIGFGTEFDKNDDNTIKNTELNERLINESHCDTSIAIDFVELINLYYKRGRAFFLDKIEDSDDECIRLSNPEEEKSYNRQMDIRSNLDKVLMEFNERYIIYKNNKDLDHDGPKLNK